MAAFTLESGQKHFLANMRALSANSDAFNMSIWIEGYSAVDCDYIRANSMFVGWSPKGTLGENRDSIDKIRQVKFWPKKEEE